MISVRFLGALRERLQCEMLLLPRSAAHDTQQLREWLATRGANWREALEESQLLLAVNGTVRHELVALDDGDEVALFPPVTGG